MATTKNQFTVNSNIGQAAAGVITRGYVVASDGTVGNGTKYSIGIAAITHATGDLIEIYPYGERRLGVAATGDIASAGLELMSHSDGTLIAATANKVVVAISLAAATAGDEFEIWTVSPYTKAQIA